MQKAEISQLSYQIKPSPQLEVAIAAVPYRPAATAVPIETFTLADLVERRGEAEFRRHQRIEFELLIWCIAGTGQHEVDFEVVELIPGRIVHIGAGQVSRWILNSTYEARLILLPPLRGRTNRGRGVRPLDIDADLQHDLDHIIEVLTHTRDAPLTSTSLDALGALVISLLDLEHHHLPDSTPLGDLFADFERLLESAIPPPRSVQQCAHLIGCSTRSLSRACHDLAGTSPKRLIDEAIALEAQRRLSSTTTSVSDVALALGFAELSNFSRFFQRLTGRSPSTFVRQLDPS